jgi:hypothetical protein
MIFPDLTRFMDIYENDVYYSKVDKGNYELTIILWKLDKWNYGIDDYFMETR